MTVIKAEGKPGLASVTEGRAVQPASLFFSICYMNLSLPVRHSREFGQMYRLDSLR